MDYDMHTLRQLNWVRLYQQVISLSDVMDASGRAIESKYLDKRPYGKQWSRKSRCAATSEWAADCTLAHTYGTDTKSGHGNMT